MVIVQLLHNAVVLINNGFPQICVNFADMLMLLTDGSIDCAKYYCNTVGQKMLRRRL